MNIYLKWKVAKKDYSYIKKIIVSKPEEILTLNYKEKITIIKFLVETSDIERLSILFCITRNYAFRKMIIEQVQMSINYKLYDALINECIIDFIEFAIMAYEKKLLEYLANYISENKPFNREYIEAIIEHLLLHCVNETTINIACLPAFKDTRLEEKIAKSKIYKYIITYILNTSKNSKFIKKCLLNGLSFEHYKLLCNDLKIKKPEAFKNLKRITMTLVKEHKIDSEYLILLIELLPDDKDKDKYINIIMSLKDLNKIRKLMAILKSEEQEKYASEALRNNDQESIFNLAFTTNCSKTKKLINYILNFRTPEYKALLITYLEGEYLEYALEKVLREQGTRSFLNIYLNIYKNQNIAYVKILDYIFNNKLESLFGGYSSLFRAHQTILDIDRNNLQRN